MALNFLTLQILLLGRESELTFHLTVKLRCRICVYFIRSTGICKNREWHVQLEYFQNYESISFIEFVFFSYGWTSALNFFFSFHNPGSLKIPIQSFPKIASKAFFSPLNFYLSFDKLTIHTPQQKDSNLYFTISVTDLMNFGRSLMFMGDIILLILKK